MPSLHFPQICHTVLHIFRKTQSNQAVIMCMSRWRAQLLTNTLAKTTLLSEVRVSVWEREPTGKYDFANWRIRTHSLVGGAICANTETKHGQALRHHQLSTVRESHGFLFSHSLLLPPAAEGGEGGGGSRWPRGAQVAAHPSPTDDGERRRLTQRRRMAGCNQQWGWSRAHLTQRSHAKSSGAR